MRWKTEITKLYELRWMIYRMEWSWFRVLITVEQINDSLFLNTYDNKNNWKIAKMNEMRMSWYEMTMRWKGRARSIPEISVWRSPGTYRLRRRGNLCDLYVILASSITAFDTSWISLSRTEIKHENMHHSFSADRIKGAYGGHCRVV